MCYRCGILMWGNPFYIWMRMEQIGKRVAEDLVTFSISFFTYGCDATPLKDFILVNFNMFLTYLLC